MKNFSYLTTCLLLCFSYIVPGMCYGPTYKLIDLGLQESDRSEAVAVNDNGLVAGMYWMLGEKYYFLWEKISGIKLIDLPETARIVVLNNAGQIAGNYLDQTGKDHGFIWDTRHGFIDIGTLGGSITYVYDMNDFGQIVGGSECSSVSLVDGRKEQHAFIWQDGFMSDLGSLIGDLGLSGDQSIAVGINNCGLIIGASNYPKAHKGKILKSEQRAVIWNNGFIEEFNKSFDGQVELLSVNDRGCITCRINCFRSAYHSGIPSCGNYVIDIISKCMWNVVAGNDDLLKINNTATVLSNHWLSFLKPIPYDNHFEECHGMDSREPITNLFNLNKQKNWNDFCRAQDINNKNWIVGIASNIYGEQHGILLVPAEHIPPVIAQDSKKIDDLKETNTSKPLLGPMIADFNGGRGQQQLIELVRQSLLEGADVNDDSRNGHRPLQLAIRRGFPEVAILLIENGADVNYRDRSRSDPISLAINCGQKTVVAELMKCGAKFPPMPTTYPGYVNWYKFRYG